MGAVYSKAGAVSETRAALCIVCLEIASQSGNDLKVLPGTAPQEHTGAALDSAFVFDCWGALDLEHRV